MAVAIRLKREGRKNRPYYRVIVTDKAKKRDGSFLDQVGIYDPLKKEENFTLNMERVNYWLKNGAQPSETVRSFLRKLARKG